MTNIMEVAKSMRKLAQDDPRRIIHSIKVGVTVTSVSLFYYSQPFFDGFGDSALWAIFSVVLIFDFTVGATLQKGLNRAVATLVAGALGLGAHSLALQCGKIGEPVFIGIIVFLQANASTFMRFFPKIKLQYDYGLVMFSWTFGFVAITGYRADEILDLALKRLNTVLIGSIATFLICTLVFPVWAGDNLHNLVIDNMNKLGNSLEGIGNAYFNLEEGKAPKSDFSVPQTYKSALNTMNTEETLANFARWEPCHGRFKFRHPWKQYLKLGALTRECAYKIDALNSHLHPNLTVQLKFQDEIREECNKMSSEASQVLKELALSLKAMTKPISYETHVENSKVAAKNLKKLLRSSSLWEDFQLLQAVRATTISSILIDIVTCTEKIAEGTNELASMAHFKATELQKSNLPPESVDPESGNLESTETKKENSTTSIIQKSNNVKNADCSHIAIVIDAADQAISSVGR